MRMNSVLPCRPLTIHPLVISLARLLTLLPALLLLTALLSATAGRADETAAGFQPSTLQPTSLRPTQWATAIASLPGLPNLFRVDAGLYRAAQPTSDGFVTLSAMPALANGDRPIHTVLSLRALDDDGPLLPARSDLHLEQIRIFTWHIEDSEVLTFLRIVTTPAMQPVLVHCQHGADRTGLMVAIYRIVVQGWSKQAALDEMVDGGYGYHPIWWNLRHYIRDLDVAALRAELAKAGPWQPTIPAFTLSLAAFHLARSDR